MQAAKGSWGFMVFSLARPAFSSRTCQLRPAPTKRKASTRFQAKALPLDASGATFKEERGTCIYWSRLGQSLKKTRALCTFLPSKSHPWAPGGESQRARALSRGRRPGRGALGHPTASERAVAASPGPRVEAISAELSGGLEPNRGRLGLP